MHNRAAQSATTEQSDGVRTVPGGLRQGGATAGAGGEQGQPGLGPGRGEGLAEGPAERDGVGTGSDQATAGGGQVPDPGESWAPRSPAACQHL